MPVFSRVILIVLDGAGCGELPDAAAYGDTGSNTLGNLARAVPLRIAELRRLGLGRIVPLDSVTTDRTGDAPVRPGAGKGGRPGLHVGYAFGRMAEVSGGKDSITGHWEMMGLRLAEPFATFPTGFPVDLIAEFERRIGRRTLGNISASGTVVIEQFGVEHMRTGSPIVYTSADSVFQIAAHEEVIPLRELYRICEVAFELVAPHRVARVIARPFVGQPGGFTRTAHRHDYALPPYSETLFDRLMQAGLPVIAIGKINDLFAGRGITQAVPTTNDRDGIEKLLDAMSACADGLIAVNLVDFDAVYGHRNDVEGYAQNLERFDECLGVVLNALREGDLLVVTADHGNDPTTPSTDHSREYVPLLVSGSRIGEEINLGTRATFADLGQTIAGNFGVGPLAHGVSFLEELVVQHS
jgi:phosphopentomutase